MVEIFGAEVEFKLAHRFEVVMIALYFLFFLWFDVVKNQVTAYGVNHSVPVVFDWFIPALGLSEILIIIFHIILVTLFVSNLTRNEHGFNWLDIVVGIVALFGVAMLLAGFVNEIYSPTISFLFMTLPSVTFYHIGVGFEVLAGLYWAFTK